MKSWHESGEAAFPLGANEYGGHGSEFGMSLRDYFAAKAMQSIFALGDSYDYGVNPPIDELPRHAYAIADAMLRERAK